VLTLNEKVVYPGHGVAQVIKIFEKSVGGNSSQFYELKFVNKDITILVPASNLIAIGVRPLISKQAVLQLIIFLQQSGRVLQTYELTASSWNRRNKFYQNELRSGDLFKIASIYRELQGVALQKELSFGEKALLMQTELLLAQEISIVENKKEQEVIFQLRALFTNRISNVTLSSATL
jgi:CarD family transcriptional regulator